MRRATAAFAAFLLLSSAVSLAGCYESRVRDVPTDGGPCAALGTHTVAQRVSRSTPGCGMIGGTGDLDVAIPPTEDTFIGAGAVEVAMTGRCRWQVHAETAIPDFSSTVDGTIDTSDGTVRGTFEVRVTGIAGTPCEATLEWTERR